MVECQATEFTETRTFLFCKKVDLKMAKLENYAKLIADQSSPIPNRLKALSEIRENMDIVQHPGEYPKFLQNLINPMMNLLMTGPIQPNNEDQHKIRNTILEILYRCPFTEPLQSFARDLMQCMMQVLKVDTEDNGLLALKIITELHKAFTAIMEDFVAPFLEIVKGMYQNMFNVVPNVFDVEFIK